MGAVAVPTLVAKKDAGASDWLPADMGTMTIEDLDAIAERLGLRLSEMLA